MTPTQSDGVHKNMSREARASVTSPTESGGFSNQHHRAQQPASLEFQVFVC